MIKDIKSAVLCSVMALGMLQAQEGNTKQAEKKFEDYAFVDAIANYEALVKKGYTAQEIYQNLGNANYLNANYKAALEWYEKLMALEDVTVEKEYLYRYAQVLKSIGEYKKSDTVMERFNIQSEEDNRAKLFTGQKDYRDAIERNSGRYAIAEVGFNSEASDFSPAFYKERLVFASARDTGITASNLHNWNKGAFLNFYVADRNEASNGVRKFSKSLNSKTHESSAAFTADGTTVYFTRNNTTKNKFKRDAKGISRLKVLRAEFKDGIWTNIKELPFNADDYSVAHPALSTDGKTLYFSSDMPGTLGASDIFKVAINDDGTYGAPENLGKGINTESRETFPFVLENTLYFASDGHPGLGGLDVFAAKLDGSSNEILNVGKPINGPQDDFSYIVEVGGAGYFASNRAEGLGDDDIYAFQENEKLEFECLADLTGTVMQEGTQGPIADAQISVVDSAGNIMNNAESNADGMFTVAIDCRDEALQLVVNKEGLENQTLNFTMEPGENKVMTVVVRKEAIPYPEKGEDVLKYLALDPILFDLDSSNVRPDAQEILRQASAYLKDNPAIKVEIRSHTDAKASDSYNKTLSQARAKATFDNLVNLGVSPQNLDYKGYGEERLLHACDDLASCTDKENEANRRSELIVVSKE